MQIQAYYNTWCSSISCSPSQSKAQVVITKVRRTTRLIRRSKKMNNKPPVPVKSDRVKNLPVARPRRNAPPKPLPYNVHREITKKPDPAPRRTVGQGNAVLAYNQGGTGTRGFVEIIDRGRNVDDISSSSPQGQSSRPSPPSAGGISSRPRLDTPVSPPDPGMAPRNGIRSPAVPQARAASAVIPSRTHPSSAAEINVRKSPPAVHKNLNLGGQSSIVATQEPYTEAFASVGGVLEDSDGLYSTVMDVPRRIVNSTPSQSPPPPLPHSHPPPPLPHSHTPPPIPHRRSPLPPSPSLPTHSGDEYNVTVHAVAKTKPPLHPDPTPVNTYSALARPDQPNKALNPTPPPEDVGQAYSVLNAEEFHHPSSAAKLVCGIYDSVKGV